jgi:lysophospholipase L1-like esterase
MIRTFLILLIMFSQINLALANGDNIKVINAGIGGNNTRDALKRIEKDVLTRKADLLIIAFGANDAFWPVKFVPIEEYRKNLQEIVDRSSKAGIKNILLMTPPPCVPSYLVKRHPMHPHKDDLNKRLDEYVKVVREVAEKNNLQLIDLHEMIKLNGGASESPSSLIRNIANSKSSDGLHLTPRGYRMLSEKIHSLIKDKIKPDSTLICFGDSITAGAHVKGCGTSKGETYPAQLKYLFDPETKKREVEEEKKKRDQLLEKCPPTLILDEDFLQGGFWETHKNHKNQRVSADTSTAYSGASSLKQDGSGGEFFILTTSKSISVIPGKTYLLGSALRRSTAKGKICLAVRERISDNNWKTSVMLGAHSSKPLNTWEYFSKRFTPASNEIRIYLYNIKSRGIAWFDNISIKKIGNNIHTDHLEARKVLGEPKWNEADSAEDFMILYPGMDWPVRHPWQTKIKTLFDDKYLYINAHMQKDVEYAPKAKNLEHDSAVYRDDSIELFIFPSINTKEFYQICVNSAGTVFDGFKSLGKESLDKAWDSNANVKIKKGEDFWQAFIKIPRDVFKNINFVLGSSVGVNFGRNINGSFASWALPKSGNGYASVFKRMYFTSGKDALPKIMSNYKTLIREAGILSNPDFEGSDKSKINNWNKTEKTLTQNLWTSYFQADTNLRFMVHSKEKSAIATRVKYLLKDGLEESIDVSTNKSFSEVQEGNFTIPKDARITEFSIFLKDELPQSAQLKGSLLRRFISITPVYDFIYRKNDSALPKNMIEVFSLYPYLSVVKDLPSPLTFIITNTMTDESLKNINKKYSLVLDLPIAVLLYSDTLFGRRIFSNAKESESPYGNNYHRYTLDFRYFFKSSKQKTMFGTPYFLADNPVKEKMHYSLKSGQKFSKTKNINIKFYPVPPKVKPLKHLMAGVYVWTWITGKQASGTIYKDPEAMQLFQKWRNAGINTIIINGIMALKDTPQPEIKELVKKLDNMGFICGMNTGDFYHYKKPPESARGVKIDGSPDSNICLSYRGPEYKKMIETWGKAANNGMYLLDHDFELWNYAENKICFCPKCISKFNKWRKKNSPSLKEDINPKEFERNQDKYPGYHAAWLKFKNQLLAEWHMDIRKELEKNMKVLGVARKGFPKVAVTKLRKAPWNWKPMLKKGTLDYVSSMIYAYSPAYTEPSIESASAEFLSDRLFDGIDRKKSIITIAPAELGWGLAIVPDIGMYYQILEVFGSGATGFKIWHNADMSGGKYYWLARALNVIQPVENIIYNGKFRILKNPSGIAKMHAFHHDDGDIVFISDYSLNRAEVNVPFKVNTDLNVYDLESRKKICGIKKGEKSFKVVLDRYRAMMFFIGTEEQWDKLFKLE